MARNLVEHVIEKRNAAGKGRQRRVPSRLTATSICVSSVSRATRAVRAFMRFPSVDEKTPLRGLVRKAAQYSSAAEVVTSSGGAQRRQRRSARLPYGRNRFVVCALIQAVSSFG